MCSHGSMAGWDVLVLVAAALPLFPCAGWHLEHVALKCKLVWHGWSGHSIVPSSSEELSDDVSDAFELACSLCSRFHRFHRFKSEMYVPVSPSGSKTTVITLLLLLKGLILATILPLLFFKTLVIALFKQFEKMKRFVKRYSQGNQKYKK